MVLRLTYDGGVDDGEKNGKIGLVEELSTDSRTWTVE